MEAVDPLGKIARTTGADGWMEVRRCRYMDRYFANHHAHGVRNRIISWKHFEIDGVLFPGDSPRPGITLNENSSQ